ncbi:hypothetical protein [Actinoplanes friuliensis]|nr:hypothetical protein [Actinoplanes friuliensis]
MARPGPPRRGSEPPPFVPVPLDDLTVAARPDGRYVFLFLTDQG